MTNREPAAEERVRCAWAGSDPLMTAYHDEEWGVPSHDDRELFDLLMLEGFQAGLSWSTILRKRDNFRRAFDGLDPRADRRLRPRTMRPAAGRPRHRPQPAQGRGGDQQRPRLPRGPGRARLLRALHLVVRRRRADRATAVRTLGEIPATTPESDAMSKDLKRRGFTFVGSTICYAFMQSAGLVDDHIAGCFRVSQAPGGARIHLLPTASPRGSIRGDRFSAQPTRAGSPPRLNRHGCACRGGCRPSHLLVVRSPSGAPARCPHGRLRACGFAWSGQRVGRDRREESAP